MLPAGESQSPRPREKSLADRPRSPFIRLQPVSATSSSEAIKVCLVQLNTQYPLTVPSKNSRSEFRNSENLNHCRRSSAAGNYHVDRGKRRLTVMLSSKCEIRDWEDLESRIRNHSLRLALQPAHQNHQNYGCEDSCYDANRCDAIHEFLLVICRPWREGNPESSR